VAFHTSSNKLLSLGAVIRDALPGLAFSLFIWPIGEVDAGRVDYLSSVPREQRAEVAAVMRAVLSRWEGDEPNGR
jgi:hypothetical protein